MYLNAISKISKSRHLALAAVVASALTLGACGKGSGKNVAIPGVDGPRVSLVDNKFLLSAVLTEVQMDFGARVPIPKMANSFIEVGPDLQSKGYLIQFGMDFGDLQALLKDQIGTIDPTTLPGGRPLPGIAAGTLPAIAISVPKLNNIVFYAGNTVFGVFIPVPFPKEMRGLMLTSRFYDSAGESIGNLSVVGPDNDNKNGGVLVLLPIVGKIDQALKAQPLL